MTESTHDQLPVVCTFGILAALVFVECTPGLISFSSSLDCLIILLSECSIDDYAKDGGQGRSDFCAVFTMSLCALELKRMLISLLFQIIRL